MDILKNLNDEQVQAVKATEGYIRLIAGAGTGKTRALTYRYAYLVKYLGINTNNILSLTFTNKASQEMKQRIKSLIGNFNDGFISTYHTFCVQFLHEEIYNLNYPENYTIIDDDDKRLILREIYEELELSNKDYPYNTIIKIISDFKHNQYYVNNIYNSKLNEINKIINTNIAFKDVENKDKISLIIYNFLLKQHKLFNLDFDDLILFTLHILTTNKEICEKWQNKIEYIQIDEFEDTSLYQFKLISLLSQKNKNLFVVADPDQLIYSWRRTSNTMELFENKFKDIKTLFLLTNYRSTVNLINCSNSLITNNKNRIEKTLIASREEGELPRYFHAKSVDEEMAWITKNIKELIKNGNKPEEIAVMYRANYLSKQLEDAFLKENISYTIYNDIEFYSRMEIKDCLSYLKIIAKDDDVAFLRIINTPNKQINETKIEFLKKYAENKNISLYQALKENTNIINIKVKNFINTIEKYRKINNNINNEKAVYNTNNKPILLSFFKNLFKNNKEIKESKIEENNDISLFFDNFIKEIGYKDYIIKSGDLDKLDNINELKNSLLKYKETHNNKFILSDYLHNIAITTEKEKNNLEGSIKLMTIHTSKGLEFDNVFICSLNEGIFPSSKVKTAQELEEERRIFYVGITRAKNNLFLSESEGINFNGTFRFPSRFIFNIDRQFLNWENENSIPDKIINNALDYIQINENRLYNNNLENKELKINDTIEHKIFGKGIIKEIKDNHYEIFFEKLNNIRTIDINYFKE